MDDPETLIVDSTLRTVSHPRRVKQPFAGYEERGEGGGQHLYSLLYQ